MTPDEVVWSHEGLIKFLAAKYQTPDNMWDDWLQECRIALWKEARRKPGDPLKKLASKVIHGQLMKLKNGRPWTGEERTMRHVLNEGRERSDATHYSLSYYQGWGDDTMVGTDQGFLQSMMSNAYLDRSERPNLETAVAAALDTLSERERTAAEARTALLTNAEISDLLGVSNKEVRDGWYRGSKKLAEELKEWIND